jgi:hypothetical protein
MRRILAASTVALMISVVLVATAGGASAAPDVPAQVAAAWAFDGVGADAVVVDATGRGRSLTLAGAWTEVDGLAGSRAGRFLAQSFGSGDATGLTPGTADVAVTAVLRGLVPNPTRDSPNVFQHGLYNDPSQLKMQIAKDGTGRAGCRFKGSSGALLLTGPSVNVTDGGWHSVTCWRTGRTLGVTVDGMTVTKVKDVGAIQPTRPFTVAARGMGAGDLSDQFVGDLDVVVWALGADARTAAPAYAAALAQP